MSRANATLASMGKELVSDELWKIIKPLLPSETSKPKSGRPRVPDRAALSGIVFVLRTGILWGMLPNELGFGQRRDLLAALQRLAEGGRLAQAALRLARQARPLR